MSSLLVVDQLTKTFYGKRRLGIFPSKQPPFTAVKQLNFSLKEGEILGILGPNGAGKTTTLSLLLGLLKPTQGSIYYFGKNLFEHSSEIMEHVTHASTYHDLPSALTVKENLELLSRLYRLPSQEFKQRLESLLERFECEHLLNRTFNSLSAGQQTRIKLVRAFLPQPRLVLLDEPTAALDPDIAHIIRDFLLKEQREKGTALLLTSHNMQEVAEICDRVLVMQKGTVLHEDTPEKLARSAALTRVFFQGIVITQSVLNYLQAQKWQYQLKEKELEVELEEEKVPALLSYLGKENVIYQRIEITKPTLEDFFLKLTLENGL